MLLRPGENLQATGTNGATQPLKVSYTKCGKTSLLDSEIDFRITLWKYEIPKYGDLLLLFSYGFIKIFYLGLNPFHRHMPPKHCISVCTLLALAARAQCVLRSSTWLLGRVSRGSNRRGLPLLLQNKALPNRKFLEATFLSPRTDFFKGS